MPRSYSPCNRKRSARDSRLSDDPAPRKSPAPRHALLEVLEDRTFLNAGGLDLSFRGGGKANTTLPGGAVMIANDVAVQSDGKVVVVGTTSANQFVVARFNASGTQDTSFGPGGGGFNLTPHAGISSASAVAIEPNGKIVVAGGGLLSDLRQVIVAQYLTDGTLDPAFGDAGIVFRQLGAFHGLGSGTDSKAADVAIQKDGKIVIVGDLFAYPNHDMFVARITTAGKYDTTFDGDGARAIGLGGEEYGNAVAIDYSGSAATNVNYGKIIIVGNADKVHQFAVARVNTNGSLDGGFRGGGKFATHFGADTQVAARGVVIQPSGKIVIAGGVGLSGTVLNFGLTRLSTNGNTDTTFGQNGIQETDFGGTDIANDLIIGQRGNLIVGGATAGTMAFAAYTANGALDPLFGYTGSGKSTIDFSGGSTQASGLALSPGGKIVATGGANGGTARFYDRTTVVSVEPIDSSADEANQDQASFRVVRDQNLPYFTRVFFDVNLTATKPGSLISSQIDYTVTGINIPNELQIGKPYVDIAPGQTSALVTLTPINDTRSEGDEMAGFEISGAVGYDVDVNEFATITIHDDDAPTTLLNATADAYVRDGSSAGSNFGSSAELQVKSATSGYTRQSYIKFDLSSVSTINSVKLQLFGKLSNANQTNIVTSVFSVADTTWTEGNINFTNAPPAGGSALASATIRDTTLQLYEFDVTAYVKAQKALGHRFVTFVFKNAASSDPYVIFNSRDAASNQPKLVIT